MTGTTICVLADSLAMPINSFLKHFGGEYEELKKAALARQS